jgi:hypothetical protein
MTTPHEEPRLFDLPLAPASHGAEEPVARRSRRPSPPPPESLPLFPDDEGAALEEPESDPVDPVEPPRRARERTGPRPVPPPASEAPTAGLAARVRAAAGDLAVLGAVGALAAAGARMLGAPIGVDRLPALALFLLAWSFLYFVVSLAFWGQTPGMAWAGLVARTGASEPLSFGQTAQRWAATWLTWALAGLPGLLALSGRSLADRLSGSRTYDVELDPATAPAAR